MRTIEIWFLYRAMIVFIYRFLLISIATYAGTSLLAPMRILGWDIDIGILALVLISTYAGRNSTVGWGMFSGFLLDCLNPQWMGAGIVARSTSAMFVSSMREKLNIEHAFLDGAVVFIAGFIDRAIYLGLSQYRENFFYGIFRFVIPSALYTAIFAIMLIFIYRIKRIINPRLVD